MSRAVDIAVATLGLVLVSPLLVLVALLVLATDGRPLLFVQLRAGRDGRTFRLRKFRTMSDARDRDGRLLPEHCRIMATGHFLRYTRLDELPQLLNILVGDMSLVGPRPLPPEIVAQAEDGGRLRSSVRPGLTGWSQVNGGPELRDADKFALDAWYVTNRSAALDLLIIIRTIPVIVRGERVDQRAIRRAHAGSRDRRG